MKLNKMMKNISCIILVFLVSLCMAQETEVQQMIESICNLQNSISAILPIIVFSLFVLAGIVFWPAVGLTILGWFLKRDKTEEQDPGAYKFYKWGILGLKVLGVLIGLAVLVLILWIIVPIVLSSITGVSPEFCQGF